MSLAFNFFFLIPPYALSSAAFSFRQRFLSSYRFKISRESASVYFVVFIHAFFRISLYRFLFSAFQTVNVLPFFFHKLSNNYIFKREVPQLWGEMNDEEKKKWNWWTKERREKMTRFVVSSLNMLIISSFRISLWQAPISLFCIRMHECLR